MGETVYQSPKRVCFVVSNIGTAEAFLLGHMAALAGTFKLCLAANCRDIHYLRDRGLDVDVIFVPLQREASPLRDVACLRMLTILFRQRGVDVVHSITPKAGLLAMLAASMTCVPVRVHTFTGQVWATKRGLSRRLLKVFDRLVAACATNVLADSRSQVDFLHREKILRRGKGAVLGNGSISGVDLERFQPSGMVREQTRARLGVPFAATLFLFVGRMKKEKGLLDLADAFSRLCETHRDAYLALVGPDEEGLRGQIERICRRCQDKLTIKGCTDKPEQYMAAADVFCLPSYREGFGSVLIEAAACGVPAVASRIYGVTDAVVEGVTGLLHSPGDVEDIRLCLERMSRDHELRERLGAQARHRAVELFDSKLSTKALVEFYQATVA